MITSRYTDQDGCTACAERKSEVEVRLGPTDQAGLIVRLCKACRRELVKWLTPAGGEPPKRKH